jgi:pimeloyl-ACP methyl ester carboxylesterase
MKLFFRKYGKKNPALIIVHGLYGMSDNWVTIAKFLSVNFEVFVIDQRNHGNSPHSDEHNYDLLQNDLFEFMQDQEIEKAVLLGHSMGGKTVMNFAKNHPEMISALIVVDISPKRYDSLQLSESKQKHLQILNAMQKIDFKNINRRQEIRESIIAELKEDRIADFILKNLKRVNGKFQWKLNLDTIINKLDDIIDDLDFIEEINGFPILFVRGEKSNYILENDIIFIEEKFPAAEILTIKNAGHWIHAEKPEEFINVVLRFLI